MPAAVEGGDLTVLLLEEMTVLPTEGPTCDAPLYHNPQVIDGPQVQSVHGRLDRGTAGAAPRAGEAGGDATVALGGRPQEARCERVPVAREHRGLIAGVRLLHVGVPRHAEAPTGGQRGLHRWEFGSQPTDLRGLLLHALLGGLQLIAELSNKLGLLDELPHKLQGAAEKAREGHATAGGDGCYTAEGRVLVPEGLRVRLRGWNRGA